MGYNKQQNQWITGPGYFVVHPAEEGSELFIDYRAVPGEDIPGWPKRQAQRGWGVKACVCRHAGRHAFHLRWRLRGGRRKGNKDLGQYFVLVRGEAY